MGLHLLALSAVVAVLAPRLLTRAGWAYRSPQLGILAWYAALAATLSAAGAGLVMFVAPWQGAGAPVCLVWRWCLLAAQGRFGFAGQVVAAAVVMVGSGLVGRLALTAVRMARAASARRERHLQLLVLAGRHRAELGATVVEHPQPAAYLVAGRDRRIVLTTGALAALTGPEVAAVLAHERAHAAGRHDLLLDGVRLLHQAFSRSVLFATARTQLGRLVELRADEVAAARHDRWCLAQAIVTLACASTVPPRPATTPASPVLAASVAATGGDAMERLGRLLDPPRPLPRTQQLGITATVVALALVPAAILAATLLAGLGFCPPMSM